MVENRFEQIKRRLDAERIVYTIHSHAPIVGLDDVRKTLDFSEDTLLKTLVFRLPAARWAFVALRAIDRVDYKALAQAVGVPRANLVAASKEEVAELGFEVGGVCPLVTGVDAIVLFDERTRSMREIRCGSGRNDRTLELNLADLARVSGATYATVSKTHS